MFRIYILFLAFLLSSNLLYSQKNIQTILEPDTIVEAPKPRIVFGGAFRVHYKNEFYNEKNKREGGELAYDVFGIAANGYYKKVKVYADMRIMAASYGGAMLREGWIGYNFHNGDDVQLGLIEDPFGNLQYNSYSWFLGIGYGLGFEGKYSLGVKYHHKGTVWDWQFAFMKNAMETFSNDPDLRDDQWSASVLGDNKEINQLSGQILYKIKTITISQKVGVSAKVGQLYNFSDNRMGDRSAFAVHYNLDYKRLGLKAQAYKYQFNAKSLNDTGFVEIGSFNYSYQAVARGSVYTIAAKYNIPIKSKLLDEFAFYSEYGRLNKKYDLKSSIMMTNGMMFKIGGFYTYLEYVAGYNHPFLGGGRNSLYNIYDNKWHARLQCNFGYYF